MMNIYKIYICESVDSAVFMHVSECSKIQKMCDFKTWKKSWNGTYHSALMHASNYYKTQKMCKKAVNICPFILNCVHNCHKSQEIYQKVVPEEPFVLKCCLDKYTSQEMHK